MNRLLAIFLLTAPVSVAAQADPRDSGPSPRYLPAMRSELQSMGIAAQCRVESAVRARCHYKGRSSLTERRLDVHAEYSDQTDTIYFYVAELLHAPVDHGATPTLLRRLMELNWKLLGCKFEWNPRTGEVRLSAVMNTDSNFDRRTFRSMVMTLDTTATRYHAELSNLMAQLSEGALDETTAAEVRGEATGDAK